MQVKIDKNDLYHPSNINDDTPCISTSKSLDLRHFSQTFSNILIRIKEIQKPILVYALNSQEDVNGAVISKRGLKISIYQIEKYRKYYDVLPILFNSKANLNSQLEDIQQHKGNIAVLHIRSHGKHIRPWVDGKLDGISEKSQVVIEACNTIDKAKEISEQNKCEVFAADSKISFVQPFINLDKEGNPCIKSLGAFSDRQKRKGYRIYIEQQKKEKTTETQPFI